MGSCFGKACSDNLEGYDQDIMRTRSLQCRDTVLKLQLLMLGAPAVPMSSSMLKK